LRPQFQEKDMPLEIGSRLASYEILELLNPGAQPEIYKASDTKQSRTVTIKLLPAHISEHSETKSRIEREVKALSELSHPSICAVHEISREGETDFVVAEYAEGETLEKRLEGGPLPLEDVLKFSLAIVDGLNKAHRQGIVHRGLRPSNILLTADGVKLLDFGISKWDAPDPPSEKPVSDARSNATLPDVPDEVVRYMAPEQISGNVADARCDIFAFGAVLYEMATGQKAFEGKNRPVLIAAIATLDPDPLSKSQPEVPPALDHIAQRCLEKDPGDRWQTTRPARSTSLACRGWRRPACGGSSEEKEGKVVARGDCGRGIVGRRWFVGSRCLPRQHGCIGGFPVSCPDSRTESFRHLYIPRWKATRDCRETQHAGIGVAFRSQDRIDRVPAAHGHPGCESTLLVSG
jgi:serine/threonine protein kinase